LVWNWLTGPLDRRRCNHGSPNSRRRDDRGHRQPRVAAARPASIPWLWPAPCAAAPAASPSRPLACRKRHLPCTRSSSSPSGPRRTLSLSGSANMSLSALCNTVTSGNAELGNSCPRRPVVSQSRQSSLGFKSGALAQEGQKGVGGRRMAVVGAPHHADGSVEGWRRRTHSDCPRRRVAHG
jgi:hypothetical protein